MHLILDYPLEIYCETNLSMKVHIKRSCPLFSEAAIERIEGVTSAPHDRLCMTIQVENGCLQAEQSLANMLCEVVIQPR